MVNKVIDGEVLGTNADDDRSLADAKSRMATLMDRATVLLDGITVDPDKPIFGEVDLPHQETEEPTVIIAEILHKAVTKAGDYLAIDVSGLLDDSAASIELIEIFRMLDAMTSGDQAAARSWMIGHNTALGCPPASLIAQGRIEEVIGYLISVSKAG
jgi:hypothetical protein